MNSFNTAFNFAFNVKQLLQFYLKPFSMGNQAPSPTNKSIFFLVQNILLKKPSVMELEGGL